jgi:hypothetical protein
MGNLTETMSRLHREIGTARHARFALKADLARQTSKRRSEVSALCASFARDRAGVRRAWSGPTLAERQAANARRQRKQEDEARAEGEAQRKQADEARAHAQVEAQRKQADEARAKARAEEQPSISPKSGSHEHELLTHAHAAAPQAHAQSPGKKKH